MSFVGVFVTRIPRRKLSTQYGENARVLWEKYGNAGGLLNTLFQPKESSDNALEGVHVQAGSLVGFQGKYGVVLGDLNEVLSKNSTYSVVMPDSSLVEVPPLHVDTAIPQFIARDTMDSIVGDTTNGFGEPLANSALAAVIYALNVTLHEKAKFETQVATRHLLVPCYMSMASMTTQRGITSEEVMRRVVASNDSLRRKMGQSPLFKHALKMALESQIRHEPAMFRIGTRQRYYDNLLSPLATSTTSTFANPMRLMTQVQAVLAETHLADRYKHILMSSSAFQLAKQHGVDPGFAGLVQTLKYTVVYPHQRLLDQTAQLFDKRMEPDMLYEFLKDRKLYASDSADFVREAGIYTPPPPNAPLMDIPKLDIAKDPQGLDRIVDSYAVENSKVDPQRRSYRLERDLVVSVEKLTLTSNRITLMVPIPKYVPRPGAQLSKSLGNVRERTYVVRLTFVHNLLNAASVQDPVVTLDALKHYAKVDEEWFGCTAEATTYDDRKLRCWTALNKLSNFLQEWEKARLQRGLLRVNSDLTRSREWMVENLRLVFDEQLALFCRREGVRVNYRTCAKIPTGSADQRVFHKFKLFKWIANSYDTFNFQLSTTPNDLTAYVACQRYLGPVQSTYANGAAYTPLGVEAYGAFANANASLEGYYNMCNLFGHLIRTQNETLLRRLRAYLAICRCHFQRGGHIIFSWRRVVQETIGLVKDKKVLEGVAVEDGLLPRLEGALQHVTPPEGLFKTIRKLTTQLTAVCDSHTRYVQTAPLIGRTGYAACIGDAEGKLDAERMIHRAQTLSRLTLGPTLAHCIVVDAVPVSHRTFRCHCFDLNMEVDLRLGPQMAISDIKVGDRLMASQVVALDPLAGQVTLQ